MSIYRSATRALALLCTLCFAAAAAQAQSTIWNAPSTDVVAAQKVYAEANFFAHFSRYDKGGFQGYGVRAVYGTGKGAEAGLNLFYTKAGGDPLPVEIQPNAKWQFYANEEKGVQAAVGGTLYLPVTHRRGSDTFGLLYATTSKKIKAAYGPRVTGGAYALVGRDRAAGTRTGALVGYEQPIARKVSFLADWFSGRNRFGYLGAGVSITTSKKSLLFVGYNVGNEGRANNYFGLYYGYSF